MHTTEELISKVSSHSKLPKGTVRRVLSSLLAVMARLLIKGKGFRFTRFGKFKPFVQENKRGYNVYRGEHIIIPRTNRVRFAPSRKLINQMNELDIDSPENTGNSDSEILDTGGIDPALSP